MEFFLKVSKLEITISGKCAKVKFNGNLIFERVGKLFKLSNEVT